MHDAASGALVATSAVQLGGALLAAAAEDAQAKDPKDERAPLRVVQRATLCPKNSRKVRTRKTPSLVGGAVAAMELPRLGFRV